MSLVQLIVERGEDAFEPLPQGLRENPEAMAETIENNVSKVIIDEMAVNPKYYEKMSQLLDGLILARKKQTLDYKAYLAKVVELTKKVQQPETQASYPAAINSPARRALYDNLKGHAAAAVSPAASALPLTGTYDNLKGHAAAAVSPAASALPLTGTYDNLKGHAAAVVSTAASALPLTGTYDNLKSLEQQQRQSKREMVTGESHFVQGRRYLLDVIEQAAPASVVIRNSKTLELRIRPGADPQKRADVLQRWYRQLLRERIPDLLAKWQPVVGVQVAACEIKRMKTRWGTCNPKARRIWLNLELAKKPPAWSTFWYTKWSTCWSVTTTIASSPTWTNSCRTGGRTGRH